MQRFPEFLKSKQNRVPSDQQFTADIEGYYYSGKDGSQVAFWECHADRVSSKHSHVFDEYILCVSGEYVACFNDQEIVLKPGDELLIEAGREQWGRCRAGTRTIHVFAGQRFNKD